MNSITLKSEAKVNFSLDILGKKDGGYHEVLLIMQTIPLYDVITIKKEKSTVPSVKINCSKKSIPVDNKNLAYKAAVMLMEHADIKDSITIDIQKRIPIGGGLGGGSSNAAAVFNGINSLYNLGYSKEKLADISKSIGSDIPGLIYGGCVLAKGTGTEVSQLTPLKNGFLLLVNPGISISTEKIYKKYDSMEIPEEAHPDTNLLIKSLEKGDLYTLAKNMKNVLEYPVMDSKPNVKNLKIELYSTNCLGALMSGSGSSVFAIYNNKKEAHNALDYFRNQHYFSVLVYL